MTDGDASAFDTLPGIGHTVDVLVITGDDSDFAGTDLTASFAHALRSARSCRPWSPPCTTPGSDQANAPERGASLAPILDDQTLSHAVSTVDDLELVQGRIAAVLTLEIVGNGTSVTTATARARRRRCRRITR